MTKVVSVAASVRTRSSRSTPASVDMNDESGIDAPKNRDLKPGAPPRVGNASIVDREARAEPRARCRGGHGHEGEAIVGGDRSLRRQEHDDVCAGRVSLKFLVDRVARLGAGGGRDSEEAR